MSRFASATTLVFIFSLPWSAIVVLPGLGTLTRLLGFLMFGAWFLSIGLGTRFRRLTPIHGLAYAWLAWNLLSLLWSPDIAFSAINVNSYAQLFLFLVILWNVVRTEAQIQQALQAFVLGCWVSAAWLIFNVITGNVGAWEFRASLENYNENEIGMLLALALPIAWYLGSMDRPHARIVERLHSANYAYIPAGIVGILVTASRGSVLAALMFVAYVSWKAARGSGRERTIFLVSSFGLLAAVVLFVPQSAFDRLSTIPEQFEQRDFGARSQFWLEGLEIIRHDPIHLLIGGGTASSAPIIGHVMHNVHLSVLFETGLIGLLLIWAIFGSTARTVASLPAEDRAMWLSVIGTFALAALALNVEAMKVTWLLIGLAASHAAIKRQKRDFEPRNDQIDRRFAHLRGARNSSPSADSFERTLS